MSRISFIVCRWTFSCSGLRSSLAIAWLSAATMSITPNAARYGASSPASTSVLPARRSRSCRPTRSWPATHNDVTIVDAMMKITWDRPETQTSDRARRIVFSARRPRRTSFASAFITEAYGSYGR